MTESIATCPVCCSEYDSDVHRAFTNPCEHDVCEPCLRRLVKDGFECVVCRRPMDLDRAQRKVSLEEHNQRLQQDQSRQTCPQTWSPFAVGSGVTLTGIHGRPQLNGQAAVIVQFVADRDRYRVQLHSGEVVALRKTSLSPDSTQRTKTERELKELAHERGNALFREKQFLRAIEDFSVALFHESGDHRVYSNRSAAHAACHHYVEALRDAQQAVTICPSFSKGWGRVAAANHGLGNWPGAIKAYETALQLDPTNLTLKRGRAQAEEKLKAHGKTTSSRSMRGGSGESWGSTRVAAAS